MNLELHPLLNAGLNIASLVCLLAGYRAIKSGARETHKRFMLGCVAASIAFLASYLLRYALEGTHRFPDAGWIKTIYLAILFSHMALAAVVPVMAGVALRYAFKEQFDKHTRWTRPLFPIWLYVSVTGVVVYAMVYHLAPTLG